MADVKLELQDVKENTVEVGDVVYLKNLDIGSQIYFVTKNININDGKVFLLNDISDGANWCSNGITKEGVFELIRKYNGKLIKRDSIKITVEEV